MSYSSFEEVSKPRVKVFYIDLMKLENYKKVL